MPISVASFTSETAEVNVPTSQGDLLVRYRPNAMTPTLERALQESGGVGDSFLDLFCEVVTEMDLQGPLWDDGDRDDDGNPAQVLGEGDPVPIEPRYVALLPSRVLGKVMESIMSDMTGADDPKTRRDSAKVSRNGSLSRKR